MSWAFQRQGQQLTIWGLRQSKPTINRLRRFVAWADLNRDSAPAAILTEVPNFLQGGCTESIVAMRRHNKQIIHARNHPIGFHSEPKRQHDIPHVLAG